MSQHSWTDDQFRDLEAQRLLSEISRNKAETEEIASRRRGWWRPSLLAAGVFLAMLAAFADFFANLYQISITDRDLLKSTNTKLLQDNSDLVDKMRRANQMAIAATALAASAASANSIAESGLYGAVLVTRWGSSLQEVHAVLLDPVKDKMNGPIPFAHGAQLGIGKPESDLGLGGGQDWSGKWTLADGELRLTEVYPRPLEKGVSIEVDLSKRAVAGRYSATRQRAGAAESGVAEIFFPALPTR